MGSGCGSVGRAVASDTRGPRFESSHQQKFISILNISLLSTVCWRDENKEKEAGYGPFLKKRGRKVDAQVATPSLLTPEVPSLNPVIVKIYIEHLSTVNYLY